MGQGRDVRLAAPTSFENEGKLINAYNRSKAHRQIPPTADWPEVRRAWDGVRACGGLQAFAKTILPVLPHHDQQPSDDGNPARHAQELFLVTCSCHINAC
jgi:hypothetical protein